MPFRCPKCHKILDEEEVCCAEVRYTWRCVSCFKLGSGLAIPEGKCFLCGGELQLIPDRDLGDAMQFHAVRDAVQFELNAFHFYRTARDRASRPEQRAVLEQLYETEMDYVHDLEENYHARLDRDMVEFASHDENLLSDWSFRDIQLKGDQAAPDLYRLALEVERRARDHFRQLAAEFPAGLENELCRELAAEEEEHIATLETELEQLA